MKGLRTKKVTTIDEGTLIVAIDIGMASNHGCCTTADGRKDSKIYLRLSSVFVFNHVHRVSLCAEPLFLQVLETYF
jgi:hypothetical protein